MLSKSNFDHWLKCQNFFQENIKFCWRKPRWLSKGVSSLRYFFNGALQSDQEQSLLALVCGAAWGEADSWNISVTLTIILLRKPSTSFFEDVKIPYYYYFFSLAPATWRLTVVSMNFSLAERRRRKRGRLQAESRDPAREDAGILPPEENAGGRVEEGRGREGWAGTLSAKRSSHEPLMQS